METLAINLRALWAERREDLPAQRDVAEKADMDQTTFGRILRAKHAPTLTQVLKLALVFNVEPWQLLAPKLGSDLFTLTNDRRVMPVNVPKFDEALLRRKVAQPDDQSAEGGDEWSRRKGAARSRSGSAT